MSKQNRTVLKTFFQTGDIPTEGQYVDLIDSNLNLSENNTGDIQLTGNITASGNIKTGGNLHLSSSANGHITASGNISASGTGSFHELELDGLIKHTGDTNTQFGFTQNDEFSVTTAGTEMLQIDGTGTTFNVNAQDRDFKVSGDGGNLFLLNDGSNRAAFPTITEFRIGQADATAAATLDVAGNIFTSGSDVGHITASGDISSSGTITALSASFSELSGNSPLNINANITASGTVTINSLFNAANGFRIAGTTVTASAEELNKLNGATVTTAEINRLDGVTATNATQLKLMDQDVSLNSFPTFQGMTMTKVTKGGIGNYGVAGGLIADGPSIKFTITNIPVIPGRASNKISKPEPTFIRNTVVTADSVILVTCTTEELSAVGFGNDTQTAIANRGFFLNIGNESADDFIVTSASFTAVIM